MGLVDSPQAAQPCHQLRLKLIFQIRMNLFWQAKITEFLFVQSSGYGRGDGINEWSGILLPGEVIWQEEDPLVTSLSLWYSIAIFSKVCLCRVAVCCLMACFYQAWLLDTLQIFSILRTSATMPGQYQASWSCATVLIISECAKTWVSQIAVYLIAGGQTTHHQASC